MHWEVFCVLVDFMMHVRGSHGCIVGIFRALGVIRSALRDIMMRVADIMNALGDVQCIGG